MFSSESIKMARTSGIASSRVDDVPELSELMGPFLKGLELEGQLTPYKVAVLVLLEQYTTYEPADEFSPAEKRRICLGFLKLFRSTSRPVSDLKRVVCVELESTVMSTIFRLLSKRGREMSLDLFLSMLYGCIATIIYGDAKASIKSTSLAGQFVRRLFIGYKKASFVELCRLWADFRQYFGRDALPPSHRDSLPPSRRTKDLPSFLSLSECQGGKDATMEADTDAETIFPLANQGNDAGDGFVDGRSAPERYNSIPNQKEALGFILKQVGLLEHDSAAALSYPAMVRWISGTRRHLPSCHELYFLEYLNEMRIRNLPAAEAALHLYVDCAGVALMSKNIFDFASSSNRLTAPAASAIPTSAFRSLRYGPLLLADMHRRFGDEDKALLYLQECIKNAEEANDKGCLDYAVALFSMMKCASKRTDYRRLLDQALKDTEDRNATALHFRCHLAQLLKSIRDCKGAKSLTETKCLIFSEIHEKLPSVAASGKDRKMTERSIKNILRVALSSAYLQRGYWNAACLEAQKLVYSTTAKTSAVNSIAITNLAYGLAAKGEYDKAKTVLIDFKTRFAKYTAESDRLNLAESLISFEMAFLAGDDEACGRHLSKIEAFSETEVRFRRALYDAARDTYSDALESMLQFLETEEGRQPYMTCRALLILGELLLHRAAKVGVAQEYLTRCQQLANGYRFAQLATTAACDLLEVEAILGTPASSPLDEHQSLGEETWFLSSLHTSCFNLSTARTMLKQTAAADVKGNKKCAELLEKTFHQLESINGKVYQRQTCALLDGAGGIFTVAMENLCEEAVRAAVFGMAASRRCFAIAHHRLGNNEERNRMSKLYRQLHERLKKSGFTALVF